MATPTKPPRTRRSPDEARALILGAAERVFAARGPDAVGLKEVAAEAGVSHALITHYFGTYEALVEAVMEGHSQALRRELLARVASSPDEGPVAWITQAFTTLGQGGQGRMLAWAFLSGRTERGDFFARRERGLATVADALETWAATQGRTLDREQLEVGLMLTVIVALGYSISRSVLWGALGHEPSPARDRRVVERFAAMLLGSLAVPATAPPEAPAKPARKAVSKPSSKPSSKPRASKPTTRRATSR